MISALSDTKLNVTYDAEDTNITYDHTEVLNGVSTYIASATGLTKANLDALNFTYAFPSLTYSGSNSSAMPAIFAQYFSLEIA